MYIFPHNPNWKVEFANECKAIHSRVNFEIELIHIGSTSIKGLYAKDCIDILGLVKDIKLVQEQAAVFESLGYVHKGEYGIAGREYFSRQQRKSHLHIFEYNNSHVDRHLNFIRQMSADLGLVEELNRIKLELQNKYPDEQKRYQEEKSDFYSRF